MQSSISNPISQNSYLHITDQADGITKKYNDPETVPLQARINTVTNSSEEKIDNAIFFPPDKEESHPEKSNLLKRLVIGAAILTGGSLLAAGGIIRYMAGRSDHTNSLDKAVSSNSALLSDIEQRMNAGSNQNSDISLSAEILPGSSLSPYSYYESIYAHPDIRGKVLPSVTLTTPESAIVIPERGLSVREGKKSLTPVSTIDTSNAEKSEAVYRHESMRDIYYNTLPVDIYRPLGKQLRTELAAYCNSDIQTFVHKAHTSSPEQKCKLLAKVVEEIDYYKEMENLLRGINAAKETLLPNEHAEEIIVRRKLTTAYLAAEYIIDGKSAGMFYNDAMLDNNIYSFRDLTAREDKIMKYFPNHHDEC